MPRLRTYAEIMALPALSAAELRLLKDCPKGERTILGLNPPTLNPPTKATDDNEIRAEILRYLILGGCPALRPDERGVQLWGAYITGTLDLNFCTAKGATNLCWCRFDTQIEAAEAQFQQLVLSGSHLPGLMAEGARVAGNLRLRNGFNAEGEVSLAGAEIGGQLACDGGRFANAAGIALNAHGARVAGDVFLRDGFTAKGEVLLAGAEIGGQLDCSDGRFANAEGFALNAEDARVTGSVYLSEGFHSFGTVSLSGAEIGGALSCISARFENSGRFALKAQSARVAGDVFLRQGFHATGEVTLLGAEIGGQLTYIGAQFGNSGERALFARNVQVKGGFFWVNVVVHGGIIDLSSAQVGDLVDDLASWPRRDASGAEQLLLDAFAYHRIAGAFSLGDTKLMTDAARRLDWLARGNTRKGVFCPQPYEQLAKVLGEMGHAEDRRLVLIEREKLQRAADRAALPGHEIVGSLRVMGMEAGDWLLRILVGYGYKPWRSFYWAAGLIAIGWLFAHMAWITGDFAPYSDVIVNSAEWQTLARDTTIANPADVWSTKNDPAALLAVMPVRCAATPQPQECLQGQGMDYEAFHSLAYAVDVVVPLVTLGQEATWAPSKDRGPWGWHLWYLRWLLTAGGWIVTAFGAAAVTGLIRRD